MESGRIRPYLLAVLMILSGLLFEQVWWKAGAYMLIALFVSSYYRYTSPH